MKNKVKSPDAKVIFSPQLANYLLGRGHTIIKLKPKKGSENESVFVFQLDDCLLDAVEDWNRLKKTEKIN